MRLVLWLVDTADHAHSYCCLNPSYHTVNLSTPAKKRTAAQDSGRRPCISSPRRPYPISMTSRLRIPTPVSNTPRQRNQDPTTSPSNCTITIPPPPACDRTLDRFQHLSTSNRPAATSRRLSNVHGVRVRDYLKDASFWRDEQSRGMSGDLAVGRDKPLVPGRAHRREENDLLSDTTSDTTDPSLSWRPTSAAVITRRVYCPRCL